MGSVLKIGERVCELSEIFSSGGHMDVISQSGDGLGMVANFRNDT
jgi:hypothetical protein